MGDVTTLADTEIPPQQILPPQKAEKIREKRAIQSSGIVEELEKDRIVNDIKVEDGRLYYDKKWYGRYQNVFVETRES